jgi:hypothetical protein
MNEELNKQLLKELVLYKETDILTDELKRLLFDLICQESKKSRYNHISENVKILCEADAYVAACKHSIHFNPERSDKPSLYVGQIIWSSYYGTIKKHAVELGLKTTRKVYET